MCLSGGTIIHSPYRTDKMAATAVVFKGIFSDSNNIFLLYESEDIKVA